MNDDPEIAQIRAEICDIRRFIVEARRKAVAAAKRAANAEVLARVERDHAISMSAKERDLQHKLRIAEERLDRHLSEGRKRK